MALPLAVKTRMRSVPREFIFFGRKSMGVIGILAALDGAVDDLTTARALVTEFSAKGVLVGDPDDIAKEVLAVVEANKDVCRRQHKKIAAKYPLDYVAVQAAQKVQRIGGR